MTKIKKNIDKTRDTLRDLPLIGKILQPKPKVAVIRLSGIIADQGTRKAGISFSRCEKMIEDAFDVYNLQAVALVINSPGGSPAQSELIGNLIRKEAEEKDVPVYAFVEDVAASGGYWLACAADHIYGVETSIVGSIGVISASFGFQKLIDQYGVERRVHTSGKDKSFLDPFIEEKPTDVKRLKALQAELHERFKDWVRERRGDRMTGTDAKVYEGAFWSAQTALDLGVIDGIGDYKAVMKEEMGDEVKFIDFAPDKGFLPSLLSGAQSNICANLPEEILNLIEDRAIWGRFGV